MCRNLKSSRYPSCSDSVIGQIWQRFLTIIIDNKPEQDVCWRTVGVWGQQEPRCERLKEVVHCYNCDVFASVAEDVFSRIATNGTNNDASLLPETEGFTEEESGRQGDASVLCFRLESYWFGLNTHLISFVVDCPPIHSLPNQACQYIQGIVSVRGELQVCFSLAQLFGLQSSESSLVDKMPGTYRRLLSVRFGRHKIAFYVDEVRGVYRYFAKDILVVSTDLTPVCHDYFMGQLNTLYDDQKIPCQVIDDEKISSALGQYLK